MPELPEVEVSRLGIEPHIVGKPVANVVVRQPQLRWPVPEEVQLLVGQTVRSVTRRAKYLLINTDVGSVILHLGMSGSLRVLPVNTEPQKHDHVDIVFDEVLLRLNDPRRFGAVLWQMQGEDADVFTHLGPEPLTDAFNSEHLYQCSRKRKKPIKTFIMDNAVVVGVGNIYANESLFLSGIHPQMLAGKLTKAKAEVLTKQIKQTLSEAIKQGGTTLKDFTQSDGKPGYFAQQLYVYGRGGDKCLRCEQVLSEVKIGQRATVFCKTCQSK